MSTYQELNDFQYCSSALYFNALQIFMQMLILHKKSIVVFDTIYFYILHVKSQADKHSEQLHVDEKDRSKIMNRINIIIYNAKMHRPGK